MDKLMDKVLTTGIAFAGGYVATKAFEAVWKKATGENAPKDVDDEEISIKKALVFAVTSAAISAGVQVLSQRGAQAGVRQVKAAYGKQNEV